MSSSSFIKPNTQDDDYSTYAAFPQQRQRHPQRYGSTLPIHEHRDRLLYALETHRIVIVVGETGSGKTTQIPQMLYDGGWCQRDDPHASGSVMKTVGCTQPRRVSAVTVAQRVAQERGATPVGVGLVGYSIQFDNQCSAQHTRIKYMTDGILIREMMNDPLLMAYSVIMVDEAHERTVNTDVILGLLKKVLRKRPELRLIVSSATLEADKLKKYFQGGASGGDDDNTLLKSCIITVQGSNFPVDAFYLSHPTQNYLQECLQTIVRIHKSEPLPGDILVFLTGQEEIDTLVEMLVNRVQRELMPYHLLALPMYAGLPVEEQLKVFRTTPNSVRKVVVATNIAETSITIEGVAHVIDCGFAKLKFYDPRSHSESLIVAPISKSSAIQRAGRAGRVRSGKCYRLYTVDAYQNLLPQHTLPEIQRTDLTGVILQLKALGIDHVSKFDFVTRPSDETVARAEDMLRALGALNFVGSLTYPLGLHISQFPVTPKLAKMLIVSGELQCGEEAATMAAMLSVRNLFATAHNLQKRIDEVKKQFAVFEGDHFTFLNIYSEYQRQRQSSQWCYNNFINQRAMKQVDNIRSQLIKYMKHFGVPIQSIRKHQGYERPIVSNAQMRQIRKEENKEAQENQFSQDRHSRRGYGRHDPHEPRQQSQTRHARTGEDNIHILNIKRCIVHGFFENVAQRRPDGQTYEPVGESGERLEIHPSSVLSEHPPPFVLYGEVTQTMDNKFVMRHVLAVSMELVQSVVPSFFEIKRTKR